VISDYPLLNCITARKFEILYSITAIMTCTIRKLTKKTAYKTFKQFFDPSNSLRVIAVLNVKIGPKCRNKDWVLGQKRVFDRV
jgi:hypothetical protein